MVHKRLGSIMNCLYWNEKLLCDCNNSITSCLALECIEKVPKESSQTNTGPVYNMPHKDVLKTVWSFMAWPFWLPRVATAADIEMDDSIHQNSVWPASWNGLCFFWYEPMPRTLTKEVPITEWRATPVPFGMAARTFLLTEIITHTLERLEDYHTETAEHLRGPSYTDDLLIGVLTVEDTQYPHECLDGQCGFLGLWIFFIGERQCSLMREHIVNCKRKIRGTCRRLGPLSAFAKWGPRLCRASGAKVRVLLYFCEASRVPPDQERDLQKEEGDQEILLLKRNDRTNFDTERNEMTFGRHAIFLPM